MKVYLNPFESNYTVSIVDLSRKQVYSLSDLGQNRLPINAIHLRLGVYMYYVTSGTETLMQKVVAR